MARAEIYVSTDVETDGPIPGPFSMLSFALSYAGRFDGKRFQRPTGPATTIYCELRPISENFQPDALKVNGLDRDRLVRTGLDPREAMTTAAAWVRERCDGHSPILVAYPLSFDWMWLYWYFVQYSETGSPFGHSRCFDVKTAFAVKARQPIARSGRSSLPLALQSQRPHTHRAVDDAIEQGEIFARLFEWQAK